MTPEIIERWTRRSLLMPDYTLGDVDFSLQCPLDNGRHTLHPEQDLGTLGRLPPEILITVVLSLDVLSLTVFRRVNKGAMVFVDSVPQYRMVYRHSPNILRSVLVIQASHFDFRTLFNALCESRCTLCGVFSGCLYLITCLRVCYLCFTEDSSQLFLVVGRKQASAILGCSHKKLQQLPHIRSVGRQSISYMSSSRYAIAFSMKKALQGPETQ